MTERTPKERLILLVEDIEDSRFLMRMGLEQLGYRVVEAGDGETAVKIALESHPDIILMDLSLPGMDGLAATAEIRKDESMREVPIVAVTAHQETDFREGAKASGFDAYVTKPIDLDFLGDLIARLAS
jgi:two-component system cell cycle response regulator DivK